MYTISFIKTESPRILINPVACFDINELFQWIERFLNKDDFKLDNRVTIKSLTKALTGGVPVRINFEGHKVALLLGDDNVIMENTDSFLHNNEIGLLMK